MQNDTTEGGNGAVGNLNTNNTKPEGPPKVDETKPGEENKGEVKPDGEQEA